MDGVLRPDGSPLPVKKGLLGLFRTDFCCFCRKILIPVPLEYPVPVHGCNAIRPYFGGACMLWISAGWKHLSRAAF